MVLGNVTEDSVEEFYQQQQQQQDTVQQDTRPQTGGEMTHARKEATPGKVP